MRQQSYRVHRELHRDVHHHQMVCPQNHHRQHHRLRLVHQDVHPSIYTVTIHQGHHQDEFLVHQDDLHQPGHLVVGALQNLVELHQGEVLPSVGVDQDESFDLVPDVADAASHLCQKDCFQRAADAASVEVEQA